MLLIVLLLMLYPSEGICGSCWFNDHTFYCSKINQDQFLYELFNQEDYLSSNYINTIIIEDSKYETIADFPNLSDLLPNITITDLAIRRSSVKSISDSIFTVFSKLVNLDLSENYIDNVAFCAGLPDSVKIANLSHNNISIIDISKRQVVLDYLDLSYNNLTKYTEYTTDRDFMGKSLDLSYNTYLSDVYVLGKNDLYILGCNVQNFVDHLKVQKMFTNFMPYSSKLIVFELFDISHTNLNSLVTEKISPNIFCQSSSAVIDFSNTNLTTIPENFFDFDSDCFELNLSYNNLSKLDSPILGKTTLKKINISFSEIKSIWTIFSKAQNRIGEINLTGNYLDQSICDTELGDNLTDLYSLDMSLNSLSEVTSNTFRRCVNLKYINMSHCLIEHVASDSFKLLRNIESINLSNNKILVIESSTFYNLKNLTAVDLSENYLEAIKENAFSNLDSLETIIFSKSNLTKRNGLTIHSGAFQDLSKLNGLQLSGLGIEQINNGAFKNMLNLNIIDLRNNYFNSIGGTFSNIQAHALYLGEISDLIYFDSTINIAHLFLQIHQNLLLSEQFLVSINLKNLHILDSYIYGISDNFLLGSYKLEYMDFKNTTVQITSDTKVFTGLFNLLELNATIFFKDLDVLEDFTFKDLHHLKSLHMSNGKLRKIEKDAFFGLNNLQHLFLNNNKIEYLDPALFRNLSLISILDLSNNALETIDLLSLTNELPYLKSLNLGHCQLKNLSESNKILHKNLETLILSNNMLTEISEIVIQSFPNIRILHMQQNMLPDFSSLYYSTNIKELRVDGNNLLYLLDMNNGNRLQFLNISNNPNLGVNVQINYYNGYSHVETFLMDNTGIRITYTGLIDDFGKHFPSLEQVGINYNQYKCDDLKKILETMDLRNVNYMPDNPRYDIDNIDGITCLGDKTSSISSSTMTAPTALSARDNTL
ncbi:toll-like receptor 6 [Diabrotica virgifera virgifera]|uniref:Chaoptin-like n=1 Tax=Diabrotica virgifera virgifera TaxID=50390 RepID=A0ABM5K8G0_DIAVI|nr:toll-like receptor 6 [Diabrotica virgifera virgifera]